MEMIAAGSLIRIVSIGASSSLPYKCLPIFVLSATLLAIREILRKRTASRARGLRGQFEEEWRQLRELEGMKELEEAVASAELRCRASTQGGGGGDEASFTWLRRNSLLSPSSPGLFAASETSMIVQYARECEHKDLDQLYAQAVLLEPMFLRK
eukprot:757160-Hanusia_phi.AAC.1